MTRTTLIFRRARLDIEGIFEWLEGRSPQGAANWYVSLSVSLRRIARNPEEFPVVSESLPRWNRKIHQCLFKTPRGRIYRIAFEWTDLEIRILRVRGPGQRPLRPRDFPR